MASQTCVDLLVIWIRLYGSVFLSHVCFAKVMTLAVGRALHFTKSINQDRVGNVDFSLSSFGQAFNNTVDHATRTKVEYHHLTEIPPPTHTHTHTNKAWLIKRTGC